MHIQNFTVEWDIYLRWAKRKKDVKIFCLHLDSMVLVRSSLAGWYFTVVVVGTLLLAACATGQSSRSMSSSAIAPSPDIKAWRSDLVTSSISTKTQSQKIKSNDDPAVITSPDSGGLEQQSSGSILLDDSQIDIVTNVVNKIIWQIQTGQPPSLPADPILPEGQDPSLTEDALEAAFSLLSKQMAPPSQEPAFELPPKQGAQLRVGLLAPLTGPYAALGNEIRRGAEMALFQGKIKMCSCFF